MKLLKNNATSATHTFKKFTKMTTGQKAENITRTHTVGQLTCSDIASESKLSSLELLSSESNAFSVEFCRSISSSSLCSLNKSQQVTHPALSQSLIQLSVSHASSSQSVTHPALSQSHIQLLVSHSSSSQSVTHPALNQSHIQLSVSHSSSSQSVTCPALS